MSIGFRVQGSGSRRAVGAKLLLFCSLALLLIGCQASDQQKVIDSSKSIYDVAAKTVVGAWNKVADQARHLDTSSTKAQLEQARDSLEKSAAQAEKEGQKQANALQDQVNRLNLAERVKDLQTESDAKLKQIDEARKQTEQNVKQSQELLDKANKEYEAAKGKLDEAQKAYDEATKRADAAWNAMTGG